MLDNLADMAATVDSLLRSQGMADLADAQKAGLTANGAALRKLAHDLAARGSGSLFYSTTTGDTAVSATIHRQDLADLMAYELNLRDTETRLTLTVLPETACKAAGTRDASGSRTAGTCIESKEPLIPLCKFVNIRKVLESAAADKAHEFVKQVTEGIPPDLEQQGEKADRDWISKKLAKMTIFAFLNRIQSYLNHFNIVCLVSSIELDSYYLISQPPRKTTS